MKNIQKAIAVVTLLATLNGCAVEKESPDVETQTPTETMTAQLEVDPTVGETYVEEETIPVRESVDNTEPASETTPTSPLETEPEHDTEKEPPVQKEPATSKPQKEDNSSKAPDEPQPPVLPPETELPTEPVTEPPATEPEVTESEPTQPLETEPPETEPPTTEEPETEPPATEEPGMESPKEQINTRELESYGRRYAASTYGYNGNANCNPSTNAGYFPGVRVKVTTMEEGYAAAREAVEYQYACDVAMGRAISVEIDGATVRRNINIYFESTDDPQVFILWCYYGGEA